MTDAAAKAETKGATTAKNTFNSTLVEDDFRSMCRAVKAQTGG